MQSLSLVPTVAVAALVGAISLPTLQDPAKSTNKDFVLEAGQHNIRELIDRAAEYLGRNYLYSESDIQNAPDMKVKLQQRLVLDGVGCEEVVSQLAYSKGLAMIPIDETRGIYEWIYRTGPKRFELNASAVEMTPAQVLAKSKQRLMVLTTVPLSRLNANALTNQLRPFFVQGGGQGTVTFGAAGRSLLLQGDARQVAAAIRMIDKIESSAPADQTSDSWHRQVEERLDEIEERLDKMKKGKK